MRRVTIRVSTCTGAEKEGLHPAPKFPRHMHLNPVDGVSAIPPLNSTRFSPAVALSTA